MTKEEAIKTLEWMEKRFLTSDNVDISPWNKNPEEKQKINLDFAEALKQGITALKRLKGSNGDEGMEEQHNFQTKFDKAEKEIFEILKNNDLTIFESTEVLERVKSLLFEIKVN